MKDSETGPKFDRLRRLRATHELRQINAETRLDMRELVYPMFVVNGKKVRNPVPSMPGICQLSVDEAVIEAERLHSLGIWQFLLFGVPTTKDSVGSRAWLSDEAVQRCIADLRVLIPDATVITDVCLCEYTDHGHCGKLTAEGDVDNDATLPLLTAVAISHAEAGAQVVAPSAMMDGQVAAIRSGLDESGYREVEILGYSAKYASAFYGPFRDAAQSAPQFGDRRSYQMAPTQREEAMLEIYADIDEGADKIMVKPALAYLDVISAAKSRFPAQPLYAYNVSGEYAMLHAAAANGWIDLRLSALETLTGIKRAGADFIITYFAEQAANWLRK